MQSTELLITRHSACGHEKDCSLFNNKEWIVLSHTPNNVTIPSVVGHLTAKNCSNFITISQHTLIN